jgi:ElaB/YqjD/DUF883 family membrane-anchored ribosome-binding protein
MATLQFFPDERRCIMNSSAIEGSSINSSINGSFRDLRNDLQAVARDAEALLKATASVTGEKVEEIRARTQETVRRAYDHLYERNQQVRRFASSTDVYVRDHSWTAIGVAVGVGLLIGLLASSAASRSDQFGDYTR